MPQSNYDLIADEYYDEGHVTSRNFDLTTKAALSIEPFPCKSGLVLELGAGRGRATEYLGVNRRQLVQLDSSEAMFSLQNREPCGLKILADACKIPLVSQQFEYVVGFLVDPFLGLESISEAYRMLKPGGKLLITIPTKRWGDAIRTIRAVDHMKTRFKILRSGRDVELPSTLYSPDRLREMLAISRFHNIKISNHSLPKVSRISPDISDAAEALRLSIDQLEIIHLVRAEKWG